MSVEELKESESALMAKLSSAFKSMGLSAFSSQIAIAFAMVRSISAFA